jgi:hypothetical protein
MTNQFLKTYSTTKISNFNLGVKKDNTEVCTCIVDWFREITVDVVDRFVAHD